ncbi:MAG: GYD domain-containing protein [Gaiellaceae bacterium]
MPKYVILLNWTEQGVKNVKDTVNRYQAARKLVESKGGTFDTIFWTAGPYDLVAVTDVPDEETGTAINLQLGATGNLRTLTMRAFTEDEMAGIIAKMD